MAQLVLAQLCATALANPSLDISSAALSAPSPELITALDRRGDLVLRGSTLDAAIFTINELWKVNIIAGELQGQVNGVFKNAPLKEILDTILLGNGYGYRIVGDSIVVSKLDQLGQINPFFISEAIQVTNAKPSELVEAARLLSTPQGKVQAIDTARTLIVIDFPERVKMIRDLVASIDAASRGPGMLDAGGQPRDLEVGYFHTQFITVTDAKLVLATVLSPVGRAEAMIAEDRLIVVDFAENLAMVERVLASVDRPRPQVQITALIYDLSLEDIEQIGINWSQQIEARTNGTPQPSRELEVANPFTPSASGALFTFTSIGDTFSLGAVAEAIQNAKDSRLLANPNVTVMDNEQALFEAVTQIPYQQITQTQQGGQLAGTAFKDAGIKLDVVPKIAADGTIEMTVRPEFSRLTGFTPGDNQPIIDTRATSTSVRVASGQTLVIGGMRQRHDVGDFAGVPGLKDVRWLGYMFRSRSTNVRESELVVFLTPRIVGYTGPMDCRSQLVLDTIDCRLDHIPRAEGCPPGAGACESCNGGPMMMEGNQPGIEALPAPQPTPMMAPEARAAAEKMPIAGGRFAPTPAKSAMYRLPPPPGTAVAQKPPAAEPNAQWPLRSEFDARYQGTADRKAVVPPPTKQAKEDSWWKRTFTR
ncbi:secretin N-terminal domain-containing protein [Aeoliella sp. SH292]|uniref:secretin N-terminal domain-containing protein n=1 Tax=Aeoliella sp. SH292 TaxID=3454464 RepID=UPI003F96E13C